MRAHWKGFTLIELIVVMGILAILATIVVIAVNPARQFAASRNAKRASDTRAIQIALDQHAADNNGVVHASVTTTPQNIGTGNLDLTSVLVPNYLSAIPFDPNGGTASDTKYVVFKDSSNRVSVVAPLAEQGRTIGYGATPNTAAQFTAATFEHLTVADNASLSVGDIDYTFAAWFYADTLGSDRGIIGKWTTGSLDYYLRYAASVNQFQFFISSTSGGSQTSVLSSSGITTGTWYYIIAWHDATANTINIQFNNGSVSSLSHSAGAMDGTTSFYLGSQHASSDFLNGRLDNVAFWKRTLTTQEKTDLYNNGKGRSYDQLTSGLKTSLISWWNLDEDSGTRMDEHGSNHLTDVNTVTDAPGV